MPETTRRRDEPKERYRYRSAVTGRFVDHWYALLHPDMTVKERIDP